MASPNRPVHASLRYLCTPFVMQRSAMNLPCFSSTMYQKRGRQILRRFTPKDDDKDGVGLHKYLVIFITIGLLSRKGTGQTKLNTNNQTEDLETLAFEEVSVDFHVNSNKPTFGGPLLA